jgi:bifunctional non-homologous end joining protein LigD
MAATRKSGGDALSAYRAKRSADRTPEPSGTVGPTPAAGRLFVVHQHAATRLHYDLRLEMDGVLRSWAVPKGPSMNTADKRLAVFVEDHPLEYGDFEGVIPEGNYGAGQVIVWDRGEWIPLNDYREGLRTGKLLFELKGYKLKGKWTLVKLKKTEKEWLLIKERDAYVAANGDDFPPGSVLSGLTVEDLKQGATPAGPIQELLKQLKAPVRAVNVKNVTPMLAETRATPFSREGWVFELKLDGYRLIASKERGVARLTSRNGLDYTPTFPEVARAIAALPVGDLIVDGELVVLGPDGLPSFQRLQQRAQLRGAAEIRQGAVELPASLFLFDCLAALGHDLRELKLLDRKAVLRRIVPAVGALRYADHFERDGAQLYAQVERLGLEGIVAKKADSPYRSRRSADWLKIRADKVDDFVVVGFSAPKGSRSGFGALHLAQYVDGTLVYSGRAGSGFSDTMLDDVKQELDRSVRKGCPCEGPAPTGAGETWVEPSLVAEVRFKEWTDEGLLRQPVFLRFRDDKEPRDCVRRMPVEADVGLRMADDGKTTPVAARQARDATPRNPSSAIRTPTFNFSNLTKVFWKEEGYTKGDLIEYYRVIAPWMLPYLHDRCLVLTRYPDGIEGKSFYQKDAPDYAHDFVQTVEVWSEDSQRELSYFVVERTEELQYIANMAAIPLHIWHSRVSTLERPDWCVIDLDPKGAPFSDVIAVALACRALCEEIGLPSYVKTTGSSGLHVLLPLGRQVTFEQSRTLGGLIAKALVLELPEITTVVRQISKREGKVYVDYMQNGHGKLIVAPFSVRPVKGAMVSMPLDWKEVTPRLRMSDYTIKTVPQRMKKRAAKKGGGPADPLLPVLEDRPNLGAVLEQLHARFAARAKGRPAKR